MPNGGMVSAMPESSVCVENRFFHNNFVNNTNLPLIQVNGIVWDNGNEGNYWSGY